MKNGLLVVILRSPPQADDEESQRDVKRAAESVEREYKRYFEILR